MPDTLPRLELVCLGTPTATVEGGGAKDLLWRRNLGLLVYLALSPRYTRSREHLIGVFWPEKPQDKAAHSLNEALRRCRATLGAGRIVTEAGRIALNPRGMSVDVWVL
jgi:DNA-binding SARP family transcriptional activator